MSEIDNCLESLHVELLDQEKGWTDSLLEEYGKLSLPSLYDFLLMHEKLAFEIRRQNKELRSYSERVSHLAKNTESLTDQISELAEQIEVQPNRKRGGPANQGDPRMEGMLNALMNMMDTAVQLLKSSDRCFETILKIVPSRSLFSSKPSWRLQLERIIEGHQVGLMTIQSKLESSLHEAGVELINPESSDPFDPLIHKAVETKPGKSSLLIQTVVRCGYAREDELLRPADVVITQ